MSLPLLRPDKKASDVLFLGDMRYLKGVDVLLKALALVQRKRAVTACLVGDGPNLAEFKALAEKLGTWEFGCVPRSIANRASAEAWTPSRHAIACRIISLCCA